MYTTIILAGKYFGFHAIMTMNQKACCGDNTPGYTDHNKMETLNYIFDQFKARYLTFWMINSELLVYLNK